MKKTIGLLLIFAAQVTFAGATVIEAVDEQGRPHHAVMDISGEDAAIVYRTMKDVPELTDDNGITIARVRRAPSINCHEVTPKTKAALIKFGVSYGCRLLINTDGSLVSW